MDVVFAVVVGAVVVAVEAASVADPQHRHRRPKKQKWSLHFRREARPFPQLGNSKHIQPSWHGRFPSRGTPPIRIMAVGLVCDAQR